MIKASADMIKLTTKERWIISATAIYVAMFITPDDMGFLATFFFLTSSSIMIALMLAYLITYIKNNGGLL